MRRRRGVLAFTSSVVVTAAVVLALSEYGRRPVDGKSPVGEGPAPAAPAAGGISFFSDEWMRQEGIPVYRGWSVDLETVALAPWPRLGARGAYVRLHGQEGLVNTYVLEIAPGGRTLPEHHIFDEYLFVLQGHGRTRLWQDGKAPTEIEWGPNTLLSPPLNAWHEHINLGDEPARLVGMTNAPPIVDFYRDLPFVFENPARFDDRWDGRAAFFAKVPQPHGPGEPVASPKNPLHVNLIPNVLDLDRVMFRWQAKRGWFACFSMCGNTLNPHVSAWEPASYQAPHRHGPGATVLIVQGEGFALMWPSKAGPRPWQDGHADSVVRTEIKRGMIYSPPDDWYHTHFNVGHTNAVYVAVTTKGRELQVQAFPHPGHNPAVEHVEDGIGADHPHLIGRAAEDPMLQRLFREALEARGSHATPRPFVEP